MIKIPNTNLTLSEVEIQAVVIYYLNRDNKCSIKIDFNKLNKSLSSSTLWDKPKNKIIPVIMEENFKTLGINYAK